MPRASGSAGGQTDLRQASVLPARLNEANREVGKQLAERGSRTPLYPRWVEAYGGEEFGAIVRAVLELTEPTAAELTPAQRDAATAHFVTTSRYEWMFWDMGWCQDQWPA